VPLRIDHRVLRRSEPIPTPAPPAPVIPTLPVAAARTPEPPVAAEPRRNPPRSAPSMTSTVRKRRPRRRLVVGLVALVALVAVGTTTFLFRPTTPGTGAPGGRTASTDGTVRIWNTVTGKVVGMPPSGRARSVQTVAFNRDGTRLVAAGDDGAVRSWDAATGQQIGALQTSPGVTDLTVTFNPHGTRLASVNSAGTVQLWALS
jgi:hypothetical protein